MEINYKQIVAHLEQQLKQASANYDTAVKRYGEEDNVSLFYLGCYSAIDDLLQEITGNPRYTKRLWTNEE